MERWAVTDLEGKCEGRHAVHLQDLWDVIPNTANVHR